MGWGTGVAVGNGVKVLVGSGVDVEVKVKVGGTESIVGVVGDALSVSKRGVADAQADIKSEEIKIQENFFIP